MPIGPIIREGAKARMAQVVEGVLLVFSELPADLQYEIDRLLTEKDHYALYRHLEDLIEAGLLDNLMRENQEFRKLLASVYGPRHPRLDYHDVGLRVEEAGAEIDWKEKRRRQGSSQKTPSKDQTRIIEELESVEDKSVEDKSVEDGVPRQDDKPEPQTDRTLPANPVPLGPSKGGPAPREPFSSRWTYRSPTGSQEYAVDPRGTCEQFLPAGQRREQDPDDEQEGQGIDDDAMAPLVARLKEAAEATKATKEKEQSSRRGFDRELFDQMRFDSVKGWVDMYYHQHNMWPDERPLEEFYEEILPGFTDPDPNGLKYTIEMARAFQDEIRSMRAAGAWDPVPASPTPPSTMGGPDEPVQDEPGDGNAGDEDVDMTDVAPAPLAEGYGLLKKHQVVDALTEDPDIPYPGLYDENWLVNLLKRDKSLPKEDTEMFVYKGWRIHSPKVQLIRIKNFLADEDVDRMLGWRTHFDEIAFFLKYLGDKVWNGTQSWGWDLQEAIRMLQTHDVFERHSYGKTKINLDFEPPVFPKRLGAPADVPNILINDEEDPEEVKPRYLIHRIPESVYDVDYQIPRKLLRGHYIRWYRSDLMLFWGSDPYVDVTAGSGMRGKMFREYGYSPDFNMAEVEDETYNKCVRLGTNETAFALREDCNFILQAENLVTLVDKTMWSDGNAARRFAKYRGAKRAAVQQCLRQFNGGAENINLISPFRKLVLPIPWREKQRLRREAQKKIVYPPLALKAPPENVRLDPYAWNFWHRSLVENHDRKAREDMELAQDRFRSTVSMESFDADSRACLTSNTLNGPYVHSFLSEEKETYRKCLKEFRALYDRLKSVQAKTPRPFINTIIEHINMGAKAGKSGSFTIPGLGQDVVTQFRRLNARNPKYANNLIPVMPVAPRDLWWLRFILGPSTTQLALEQDELREEIFRKHPVFTQKLRMLLDNPYQHGVLASDNIDHWKDIQTIALAINQLGNGGDPNQAAFFSDEAVESICLDLAGCGVLDRITLKDDGKTLYRRPVCNLHPEERINWYAHDSFDKLGHPVDPDKLDPGTFPPEDSVWDWIAAATINLQDSSNLRGSVGPSLSDRASFAFRLLGFRMGYWIHKAEGVVFGAYEKLEEAGLGKKFTAAIDMQLLQTHDLLKLWRHRCTIYVPSEPVTYGSVVKAADPKLWTEEMSGKTYDSKATQLVQANKLRELHEAENMLWPVRQNWARDGVTGEWSMTLGRGSVWDFARPGTHGRYLGSRKKYFSMDRWPLHLQSPERRSSIVNMGFLPSDLDIEYSIERVSQQAMAEHFVAQLQQLEIDNQMLEAQLQHAHSQLANTQLQTAQEEAPAPEPRPKRPTKAPFPEFGDYKWRYIPGVTEFWAGDTRLQQKTLEKKWKARIEHSPPPESSLLSFFRPKPRPVEDPDPSEPEVKFPQYTDAQRAKIPRSYPRPRDPPHVQLEEWCDSAPRDGPSRGRSPEQRRMARAQMEKLRYDQIEKEMRQKERERVEKEAEELVRQSEAEEQARQAEERRRGKEKEREGAEKEAEELARQSESEEKAREAERRRKGKEKETAAKPPSTAKRPGRGADRLRAKKGPPGEKRTPIHLSAAARQQEETPDSLIANRLKMAREAGMEAMLSGARRATRTPESEDDEQYEGA